MSPFFRVLAILLPMLWFPATGTLAGQGQVDPAINRPFVDPDFERWVATFEHPRREVYAKRSQVLRALDLKPGMAVADIGAGTGFYTLLFARAVAPGGTAYAVDISRGFVENIMRRARAAGLVNVVGVVNDSTGIGLAPESIDLAFLCDTYHHFEQPQAMLASIRRALRPGGRLVIIDYRREPGVSSRWILEHVRAGREQVIGEVTRAGFELVKELRLLKDNYFLVFRKPG